MKTVLIGLVALLVAGGVGVCIYLICVWFGKYSEWRQRQDDKIEKMFEDPTTDIYSD